MEHEITDTPETDAAAFEASFEVAGNIERDMVVSAVVARRLERERNEARGGVHSCHANCQRPLCRMRRKLDEARRIAEELDAFRMRVMDACDEVPNLDPLPWRSE